MMPNDGKGGRDLAPEERADEHEKFSHETIGAGEAERGQGENHQQGGIQRHRPGQSDIVGNQTAVGPLVDDPNAEE